MTTNVLVAAAAQAWLHDDIHGLDDQHLIDDPIDDEHARRRLEAEHALRLVELSTRATAGHHGFTPAAVAGIGLLLGISTRAAHYRIDQATTITDRPQVWDAWHQGRLDRTQALKTVTLLAEVPDPLRAEREATAIAYAHGHTTAGLHRKLLALTCDHDPTNPCANRRWTGRRWRSSKPPQPGHHHHPHQRRTSRSVHASPRRQSQTPRRARPPPPGRPAHPDPEAGRCAHRIPRRPLRL